MLYKSIPRNSTSRSKKSGGSPKGDPDEWGSLDLSKPPIELPPPAEYTGKIAAVRMISKGDTLWMHVSYRLDGHFLTPAPNWGVIAAREGSPYHDRLTEGHRLLHRLAAAALVDLAKIRSPKDIPALLTGRHLLITVGHETKDGVPELVALRFRSSF